MELYFYSTVCLHGVERGNFTFIETAQGIVGKITVNN
jgi:hypothetical protein